MRRDRDGVLRKVASNPRLLFCGPCAGTGGWLRAEPGSFTVFAGTEDVQSARAAYRFDYDRATQEWRLAHVTRRMADPRSGSERPQELDVRDFGSITFARFDPARLPPAKGKDKQ